MRPTSRRSRTAAAGRNRADEGRMPWRRRARSRARRSDRIARGRDRGRWIRSRPRSIRSRRRALCRAHRPDRPPDRSQHRAARLAPAGELARRVGEGVAVRRRGRTDPRPVDGRACAPRAARDPRCRHRRGARRRAAVSRHREGARGLVGWWDPSASVRADRGSPLGGPGQADLAGRSAGARISRPSRRRRPEPDRGTPIHRDVEGQAARIPVQRRLGRRGRKGRSVLTGGDPHARAPSSGDSPPAGADRRLRQLVAGDVEARRGRLLAGARLPGPARRVDRGTGAALQHHAHPAVPRPELPHPGRGDRHTGLPVQVLPGAAGAHHDARADHGPSAALRAGLHGLELRRLPAQLPAGLDHLSHLLRLPDHHRGDAGRRRSPDHDMGPVPRREGAAPLQLPEPIDGAHAGVRPGAAAGTRRQPGRPGRPPRIRRHQPGSGEGHTRGPRQLQRPGRGARRGAARPGEAPVGRRVPEDQRCAQPPSVELLRLRGPR